MFTLTEDNEDNEEFVGHAPLRLLRELFPTEDSEENEAFSRSGRPESLCHFVNGAEEISDIEGKPATGSGERVGI